MLLDSIIEVDAKLIHVNPFQPRRSFGSDELEELAQSIKAVGILHPPLVRPLENGTYQIISGERRFRAAQLAGLEKIPVVVRSGSSDYSAQAALIENIQRVDLNPLEISRAIKELIDLFGVSQEEISSRIGKKRSTVANYLRLLGLPKGIQESVKAGLISMGHAKAILSLEGEEQQNLLHEIILRDDLTVREAEDKAVQLAQRAKRKNLVYREKDFFLEELSSKLQQQLGTKVQIEGKGKKGRIFIDYYNLDDLDRILSVFGIKL